MNLKTSSDVSEPRVCEIVTSPTVSDCSGDTQVEKTCESPTKISFSIPEPTSTDVPVTHDIFGRWGVSLETFQAFAQELDGGVGDMDYNGHRSVYRTMITPAKASRLPEEHDFILMTHAPVFELSEILRDSEREVDGVIPAARISTYHIYPKNARHTILTPNIDPSKEKIFGPSRKEAKEKRKAKKAKKHEEVKRKANLESGNDSVTSMEENPPTEASDEEGFFIHWPYLSFHCPPRVLYDGTSRAGTPKVLIHSDWFWKRWKLQLGPSIAKPGLLDPRGVVNWRSNGGEKKQLKADDKLFKGYDVRTWRLWGESGKEFVRSKADFADRQDEKNVEQSSVGLSEEKDAALITNTYSPPRAEEVVYLRWTSPFSRDPRRHHFRYAGIDFYWKGTSTVSDPRRLGKFCRYSHLKLVALVPCTSCETAREVCLSKFTSSIGTCKAGRLDLFDDDILRLVQEHMPSVLAQEVEEDKAGTETRIEIETPESLDETTRLKKTFFYRIIVSTAMCMIIGEYEKRKTIRDIIKGIILEGACGAAA